MRWGPWREFIPKSYDCLKRYSLGLLRADVVAGVTVGIIALPLAMAFAIASGVPPERGLFTAIVAGFLISALGGSRGQIGGPTGAFVVLVFDIVLRNGYEGLAVCTFLAGLLLMVMGFLRLGSWIKYIPYPLVVGFTTGIALIIFSSQMKDLFGLRLESIPASFALSWKAYAKALPTWQMPTAFLGVGTLGFILFIRRFFPRIPWGIAAIVVATLAVWVFALPVETVEMRFGLLPRSLPVPSFSFFHIPEWKVQEYLFDALAIACLAGIESLLSAVIADGMMGTRHKSNVELVGQGIANCASALFGGIPATGALARTAANVKTGAKTPVAGMIHAFVLLLILMVLAPVVSQVPLAALAAVLVVVSWNMSEVHAFRYYLKTSWQDALILLSAFLLTLFVDITFAIVFGTILASFLFLRRMSESGHLKLVTPSVLTQEESQSLEMLKGIEVYEVGGPFFFGTADLLKNLLTDLEQSPKVFILRLGRVPFMDSSGAKALVDFSHRCHKAGSSLVLADIHDNLSKDLKRFHLMDTVSTTRIFPTLKEALQELSKV